MVTIVVVMGVAGSGKTTLGTMLADAMHCAFLEGDSLHSAANVEKMTHGVPLTDDDRAPWLAAIHARLLDSFTRGECLVVGCSALKQSYRTVLADGVPITWIYLTGPTALIRSRLQHRTGHYMKAAMLASQLEALEPPSSALIVDVSQAPGTIVEQILAALRGPTHPHDRLNRPPEGRRMKAIAIVPGTKTVRLVDRPEPPIVAPDDIKLRVLRVGICGTDREEAGGGRAKAPPSHQDLVLGHEMFGQVVDVGNAVTLVKPGDYAVFTVRRGCGTCRPCAMNRSDMCRTGLYAERGIWGLDGYQSEFVVDREPFAVRVAPELEAVGVLTEPFSVAEKAISEAVHLQLTRLPDMATSLDWLSGKRCLVAGLGPIGLLAALSLRLRNADVCGLDVVDADTPRPRWLNRIGGHYIDGRQVPSEHPMDHIGTFDVIVEATGIAALEFDLLDALAMNGVYAVTGIPVCGRPLSIDGAKIMRRLVLQNQVLVGSVNASHDHFQLAVNDLVLAEVRWPHHVLELITHRHAYTDFDAAFQHHGSDEIKVVLEWAA